MIVKTLYKPLIAKEESAVYSESLTHLLDAIILNYSDLIIDVENGLVSEKVLQDEMAKWLDGQKGIFDREKMLKILYDTLFGYGQLEPLLDDDSISDIDVLRYDHIILTQYGEKKVSDVVFEDQESLERFLKLIVLRNGGLINEIDSHCRISDTKRHLRINATLPPRSLCGPTLNIRKHLHSASSLEALKEQDFLTLHQVHVLKQLNREKKNILIAGKGGAGKTTLLRSIIEDVDNKERMLICETDAELYPQAKNAMVQTIKKDHLGGKPQTLSHLVRDGLTMSLDTYCVGELVGEEAWDFIEAGHTSHRVLATIHANNALDVFDRLMMLIQRRTHLSETLLNKMIAESIDVIIYVEKYQLKEIAYINGLNGDGKTVNYELEKRETL